MTHVSVAMPDVQYSSMREWRGQNAAKRSRSVGFGVCTIALGEAVPHL